MKVLPKAKNKLVDEAFALYRQGLKLKDIAEKLDVPSGTIRRWKSTYKWDSERSEKITNVRNGKKGRSRSWIYTKHEEAVKAFEQGNEEFLNRWVIEQMNNSEQIEQLMNQLYEIQQKKQQVEDEESEIRATLLETMKKEQIEKLENVKIKINYIDKSYRRTVNGKLLRELYPECIPGMYKQIRSTTPFESSDGVSMTGELKVEYVVGGTTVTHYMTQLQLSELLKDTDVILLSVNAPTVKRYRRKKR